MRRLPLALQRQGEALANEGVRRVLDEESRDGLICAYILDAPQGEREVDWQDILEWTADEECLWTHFDVKHPQSICSEDVKNAKRHTLISRYKLDFTESLF